MTKQRYISRLRRRPSWPLLVFIVLFHIAVFYGLARALAPDFTSSVEREVVSAFTVTITAPPDPPPPENEPEPDEGAQGDPGEQAVPQPLTAPSPRIERQPQPRPRASSTGTADRSGARESGDGTGAAGVGDGTGSGNRGGGPGGVAVTKPSVKSGRLDTASDFPVPVGGRQARFGKSVTVAFTVTTDGRARNCSVARSSADAETAALVCGLVFEKIRFNPARDRNGQPVEARYGYRVDFRER